MLKLVVHEHVGGLRSLLGHYQLRQLLKLIKFAFHPEDGRWVLASGSAFPERAQPWLFVVYVLGFDLLGVCLWNLAKLTDDFIVNSSLGIPFLLGLADYVSPHIKFAVEQVTKQSPDVVDEIFEFVVDLWIDWVYSFHLAFIPGGEVPVICQHLHQVSLLDLSDPFLDPSNDSPFIGSGTSKVSPRKLFWAVLIKVLCQFSREHQFVVEAIFTEVVIALLAGHPWLVKAVHDKRVTGIANHAPAVVKQRRFELFDDIKISCSSLHLDIKWHVCFAIGAGCRVAFHPAEDQEVALATFDHTSVVVDPFLWDIVWIRAVSWFTLGAITDSAGSLLLFLLHDAPIRGLFVLNRGIHLLVGLVVINIVDTSGNGNSFGSRIGLWHWTLTNWKPSDDVDLIIDFSVAVLGFLDDVLR
jgi:hypothetical protein